MNKRVNLRKKKGQSILEYTLILGVVTAVIVAMSRYVQRGAQGMIKVVADQVGVQTNGDQVFNFETGGVLNESYSSVEVSTRKGRQDFLGNINYLVDDEIAIQTNSLFDLGFTEFPDP